MYKYKIMKEYDYTLLPYFTKTYTVNGKLMTTFMSTIRDLCDKLPSEKRAFTSFGKADPALGNDTIFISTRYEWIDDDKIRAIFEAAEDMGGDLII